VYGIFHGCVDFLLVARVIFMSFSGYFRWIFVSGYSFDSDVFAFRFICGYHGYLSCASLCLIMTPHSLDLASN
jgi:hypothetical protein